MEVRRCLAPLCRAIVSALLIATVSLSIGLTTSTREPATRSLIGLRALRQMIRSPPPLLLEVPRPLLVLQPIRYTTTRCMSSVQTVPKVSPLAAVSVPLAPPSLFLSARTSTVIRLALSCPAGTGLSLVAMPRESPRCSATAVPSRCAWRRKTTPFSSYLPARCLWRATTSISATKPICRPMITIWIRGLRWV